MISKWPKNGTKGGNTVVESGFLFWECYHLIAERLVRRNVRWERSERERRVQTRLMVKKEKSNHSWKDNLKPWSYEMILVYFFGGSLKIIKVWSILDKENACPKSWYPLNGETNGYTWNLQLMKTRMTIAARSRDCTHLQCFDLDSYLMVGHPRYSRYPVFNEARMLREHFCKCKYFRI